MKIELTRRHIFGASLVLVAGMTAASFCAGRASAQTGGNWEGDYYFTRGMLGTSAAKEHADAYKRVLQNAIGNKERTQIIAGANATRGEVSLGEVYAVQLMQNQKVIEQNARIIQLLEAKPVKK